VLTLQHRALTGLAGDGHLGLSLATLDDLVEQLTTFNLVEFRSRVAAVRLELTMESNIHRLAELYEVVAG